MQPESSISNHIFKARDFGRKHAAPQGIQTIIATPGVITAGVGNLLYQTLLQQSLQVVIERARAELVPALGLPGHLQHDSIAVQILTR